MKATGNDVEITIRLESVTPAAANNLLASSPGNRRIRLQRVALYAEQMARGRWTLNPQPIIVDEDGKLINGHHRLLAVKKAGIPVQLWIARGCPREFQPTIDLNPAWTLGDILHADGVTSANLVAAVAVLLNAWDHRKAQAFTTSLSGRRLPNDVLRQTIAKRGDEIRAGTRAAARFKLATRLLTPSVVGFLWIVFSDVTDTIQADLFFSDLDSGASLERGDPVLALRQRLLSTPTGRAVPKYERIWLTIKTWNFRRRGQSRDVITVKRTTETFPEVE